MKNKIRNFRIGQKTLFAGLIAGGLGILVIFIAVILYPPKSADELREAVIDNNFKAYQTPTLDFETVAYASDLKTKTKVYDSNGNPTSVKVDVKEDATGGTQVEIPNTQQFTPGKYKVEITDGTGRKIEQDFTWGVLAINPDKATYKPGDNAFLSLAVLDEEGKMVCNGEVTLAIKDPNGKITNLTTIDKSIKVNPECTQKKYVEKPDYEANYKTTTSGTYEMVLTAITPNGTYTIKDFFTAENNAQFDIQRESATRIYPYSPYPVKIKITASEDFTGQIKESVPASFKISELDKAQNAVVYQKYVNIEEAGEVNYIVWDVSLKKGQTINLGYKYNAPIISPQFYLIGPLRLSTGQSTVFEEIRQWQIAADAIARVQLVGEASSTSSDTTLVITVANNTTVNNHLIMAISYSGVAPSVTDTKGNTWNIDVTQTGGYNVTIASTKLTSALTTSDTITISFGMSTWANAGVNEFSGLSSTNWFDKSAGASISSANIDTGLTATTSQADELLIGAFAQDFGSATPESLSPAWNNIVYGDATDGFYDNHLDAFYRIVSNTGQFAAKGTNGMNPLGAAAIATYKMSDQPAAPSTTYESPYYKNTILNTSNLVGYWRLGETSGTIAYDQKGLTNLTYYNSPTLGVSGAIINDNNKAVTLVNTTPNNIYTNSATGLPSGDSPFTYELWLKTSATGYLTELMGRGNNSGEQYVVLRAYNGGIDAYTGGQSHTFTSAGIVNDNAWHHIVMTYDGTTAKAYVDGAHVGSDWTPTDFAIVASTFRIGGGYSNYLNGTVDEAAIYSKALTPAEVKYHYNAGVLKYNSKYFEKIMQTHGLVSYWRLGETSGNAQDSIAGGNSGSYTGGYTQNVSGAINADTDTAASFTKASSGLLTVADEDRLDFGDIFSIEFWYKRNSISNTMVVFQKGTTSTSPLIWFSSGNHINFSEATGSTVVAQVISGNDITAMIDTASWHHVVVTKNGSTARMYIDGLDRTSVGTNVTFANNTSSMTLGGPSNYFDGRLDEFAIYNVALDANTVKQHYYAGAPSYKQSILKTNGLVCYWHFDEASGIIADDVMNNCDAGLIVNGPTMGSASLVASEATGTSFTFSNPSHEFVDGNNTTALDLGDGPLSLEAWVKSNNWGVTSLNSIFGKGTNSFFLWVNSSGYLLLSKRFVADIVTSTIPLTTGVPHHVVATKNGSAVKLYIDGVDVTGTVTNQTLTNNTASLGIGSSVGDTGGADWMDGTIDEPAIYNVVLTPSQVKAHFYVGQTTGPAMMLDGGLKMNGIIMQ